MTNWIGDIYQQFCFFYHIGNACRESQNDTYIAGYVTKVLASVDAGYSQAFYPE